MDFFNVPTFGDLLSLPKESRVILALRAAQRVEPFFHKAAEPARGHLQQAMKMLEHMPLATAEALSESLSKLHNNALGGQFQSRGGFAISTVGSVLYAAFYTKCQASLSPEETQLADDSVAKGANFAALNSIKTAEYASASYEILGQLKDLIWSDYEILKQKINLPPDIVVSNLLMRPLWPEGLPSVPPWTMSDN